MGNLDAGSLPQEPRAVGLRSGAVVIADVTVTRSPDGSRAGAGATPATNWRQALQAIMDSKLALAGIGAIIFMILFCYVGPIFYHPNETNAQLALQSNPTGFAVAPTSAHLLGVDPNGFDELGRLMVGGQNSLEIGFIAALTALVIGVLWGAVAGFFGGWIDALMMRIVDTLYSIPTLLLLIVLAVIFRPTVFLLIAILAGTSWLVPARLIRSETLTLRTREYVQSVRIMGGRSGRMICRHIVPNVIGTMVVNLTFQIADTILYVAALGFLGLGVQPPETDWGSMLSTGINYATLGYWWLIYPAGLAIVVIVVAFNFVGDGVRDALEVRLQRR
jgi:peptide/nickel transport system permease protein